MKRLVLATTSLVVAGGMAAADVSVTGSAELGVSGEKGMDAKLHRDIRVKFGLSGATDTGLSFGASADFHNAGKYRAGDDGTEGAVHISGAFGTLTLGNTDGAFDKALTEVGSATAIADDHTSHPGYSGNSGHDGFSSHGGAILRYDYSIGGVTASVSAEQTEGDMTGGGTGTAFTADTDYDGSAFGVGVAWSGDVGGIGMGVGLGYQSGKRMDTGALEAVTDDEKHTGSILGVSISADMGNGFSIVGNYTNDTYKTSIGAANAGDDDTISKSTYTAVGIAYTVDNLTIGVNAGRTTTKVDGFDTASTVETFATRTETNSGAGLAVVYGLGEGVAFQAGFGSGTEKRDFLAADGTDTNVKKNSWSAGLAFSF